MKRKTKQNKKKQIFILMQQKFSIKLNIEKNYLANYKKK